MSNFIVADCETSSLHPHTGSILSIGAVRRKGAEEFYGTCRIWDGAEVSDRALRVNGFTSEQITNPLLKSESELLKSFLDWAGKDAIIIGMNPHFDFSFFDFAAQRAGIEKLTVVHRTVDLHTLAITYAVIMGKEIPKRGFCTDDIYAMINMPSEPRPHNALTGAKMENEAFQKIFYSIVKR